MKSGVTGQLLAMLLVTVPSHAEEQPVAEPSIDQRLLDGLDSPNPLRPNSAATESGEDIGTASPNSSLSSLAKLMKSVEQRIRRRDTSKSTQRIQRDIADELAKMLAAAEQQQSSQASSTTSSETQTSDSKGEENGEQGDPESKSRAGTGSTSEAMNAVWGALPAQLRQQIQSPLQEDFLPRYERVIKEYYRRVAEQQRRLRD